MFPFFRFCHAALNFCLEFDFVRRFTALCEHNFTLSDVMLYNMCEHNMDLPKLSNRQVQMMYCNLTMSIFGTGLLF